MTWCWWCCHPFEGPQLHLPYNYDDKTKKFSTTGCFCSWECMRAFAIERYRDTKASVICMNIKLMYKYTTGKSRLIKSAPSRWALKEFGGHLDIEEFRKVGGRSDVIIKLPDECHNMHTIVETSKKEVKCLSENEMDMKMNAIHTAESENNEPLKLKRNKPLRREKVGNLEQSLGLVRTKV